VIYLQWVFDFITGSDLIAVGFRSVCTVGECVTVGIHFFIGGILMARVLPRPGIRLNLMLRLRQG
jgi:hypothetical protein